jgi:hypothetical protein
VSYGKSKKSISERESIVVMSLEDNREETRTAPGVQADFVREVFSLPSAESLKRILALDHPEGLVRSLSRVDFYWLVKKVGDEDSLSLLQMASYEQWQYLMDMEFWKMDRLSLEEASVWITRLNQADPRRLSAWLRTEGERFAYFYFSGMIKAEVRRTDEVYDLGDGFVSFDNVFFFKVLNPDHEELVRSLLQFLAATDYERYQALLLGIQGTLTSEMEEEMYRLRNMRLAEDGFLPYEEAISIYSRLKPESLKRNRGPGSLEFSPSPQEGVLVPITPMIHTEKSSFLIGSMARISDPLFMDRIRLEFAGLCNQVIAADGLEIGELEVLLKACRKAAGYISLGLEKVSDRQLPLSEEFLRSHPLLDIFRVGYGLALELRWEAEQWLKKAWFVREGFRHDFWEEEWEGILSGLLEKRPRLFVPARAGESYKDFENLSEIDACRAVLDRMMLLDRLLENIAFQFILKPALEKQPHVTFSALLFTYWARQELQIGPGFEPLAGEQIRDLLNQIRKGQKNPPYRLEAHDKPFVQTFMDRVSNFDAADKTNLKETLSHLWQGFAEEYAMVKAADLDPKFVKYLLVTKD